MDAQPPSPAGSSTASWPAAYRAHHQSITELLHSPQRDASSFLPAFFGPSAPSSAIAQPLPSINEFAAYLRDVDAPYKSFLTATSQQKVLAHADIQAGQGQLQSTRASLLPLPSSTLSDDTSFIPPAYFSDRFSLATSAHLASLQVHLSPSARLSTAPQVASLRKTLETYQSALEARLHTELTAASGPIAAALAHIRLLRSASALAASSAKTAAVTAAYLPASTASGAIEIHALTSRGANARAAAAAVKSAAHIFRASHDAHSLADAADHAAAIDAIEAARDAISAADPGLAAVSALAPARARLSYAVERIDAALRADLRAHLLGSDRVVEPAPAVLESAALIARLGRTQTAHRALLGDVRVSVEALLAGARSIDAVANASRNAARRAAVVHSVFFSTEAAAETEDGRSGGASDRDAARTDNDAVVRELHVSIIDLVCAAVDRLLGDVEHGMADYIVLLDDNQVTEANFFDEAKGAVRFGDAMRNLITLIADLDAIFDSAYGRSAKQRTAPTLGSVPSSVACGSGGALSGAIYAAVSDAQVSQATLQSSVRCRNGSANALRAKVSERSLAFINALHQAHADALTASIQADRWVEVTVPVGVLRLVACLTGDSVRGLDQSANCRDQDGTKAEATPKPPSSPSEQRMASAVVVHEEAFKTVSCGLRYVRSICAFALFVDKLPFAASEAARRGLEISRLFNTMCGRAILGAAALQSAGLRSITARHLALASRTIALAAALAPHVSAPLQNAVIESQVDVVGALMRRTEKDLSDHCQQLLAKILSIMMDRLAVHEEALGALPWTKLQEMQRFATPSPYVVTLAKEATVLHRILWSLLPPGQVSDIFKSVCLSYGSRLSEKYGSLNVGMPWVRMRVAADVSHLHESMSSLDVIKVHFAAFGPIQELHRKFVIDLATSGEDDASQPAPVPLPSVPNETVVNETVIIRAVPSVDNLSTLQLESPSTSSDDKSEVGAETLAGRVTDGVEGLTSGAYRFLESGPEARGDDTAEAANGMSNCGTGTSSSLQSRDFEKRPVATESPRPHQVHNECTQDSWNCASRESEPGPLLSPLPPILAGSTALDSPSSRRDDAERGLLSSKVMVFKQTRNQTGDTAATRQDELTQSAPRNDANSSNSGVNGSNNNRDLRETSDLLGVAFGSDLPISSPAVQLNLSGPKGNGGVELHADLLTGSPGAGGGLMHGNREVPATMPLNEVKSRVEITEPSTSESGSTCAVAVLKSVTPSPPVAACEQDIPQCTDDAPVLHDLTYERRDDLVSDQRVSDSAGLRRPRSPT
jgi:Vps54-like protein